VFPQFSRRVLAFAPVLLLSAFLGLPAGPAIAQSLDCVEAGDFYQSPQSGIQEPVVLGPVTFTGAKPAGAMYPLDVVDCYQDGRLDVGISWSLPSAGQLARIQFSRDICGGAPPQLVEVVVQHGYYCILHGLNEAGAEVATATAASHSSPQALLLGSPSGIRAIEVEGELICVLRVCWQCKCEPADNCVEAGDVFSFSASDLPEVNLGWVKFTEGQLADGTPVPLDVVDCSQNDRLDVWIPWTKATAKQKARIEISQAVCCGHAPQLVEVVLRNGNYCILEALDDSGAVVATVEAADHSAPQSLILWSPTGIRTIEVEGSEICVLRVCWRCVCEPADGCVEAGNIFDSATTNLPEVDLGWVTFTQGILATGQPIPLVVSDCSQDGRWDVQIPWSEASAKENARIELSQVVCCGNAPQLVEVILQHGKHCILHALDDAGALVATATAASHSSPQSLILWSPTGIRTIEVVGSEICVMRVCWRCECIPGEDCVEAGDVFSSVYTDLSEVDLGWVTFTQARLPDGFPSPLAVDVCAGDLSLGVLIPWSEASALENAMMQFSPLLCCGTAPKTVHVKLQRGAQCILHAFNDAGELVDSATAGPAPTLQTLILTSFTGIRSIRVVGSQICIARICWSCEPLLPEEFPDPIWVDAANTSGLENGSEVHPFNTIAEAMTAAVTHTIQVREGVYPESVELKDGVKLVGAGAGNSVISADLGSLPKNGIGAAVSCIGVGTGSLLAGFTITGGSVGVYCHSSYLAIRENTIADIALGSTSGDGIRLDDSGPLIQNNVIYRVGGMGIRAQGNSEPDIINNTLFDVRYYAGISFAAAGIGAVNPVIKNNIFVRGNEEPVAGFLSRDPATPSYSFNDVFDPANTTGTGGYYARSDGAIWHEIPGGPGAISEPPEFVDEEHGYFYLDTSSPCIDAGDPNPIYNDVDGTRNDMGAFGGNLLDVGGISHLGSGFLFTSVGKIVVTEIIQEVTSESFGLTTVSATAAADYYIPMYKDSPFGGYLWIRGLFGAMDDVDLYQFIATPEVGSGSFTLDYPLVKTKYEIGPGGTVTSTRVRLGPDTIGGVPDLYQLNKGGYWSQQDLRVIFNTTGLNGRYRLDYKAYRLTGPASVEQVLLPPNDLDHLTLWLDNTGLEVTINDVMYADHTPIEECEDIVFPHDGSEELIFNITARSPGQFLRYYLLDCYWGHDHYGGRFTYDQYVGSHDIPPPTWEGVINLELPPLLPRDSLNNQVPWEDCAYRFRLAAGGRTTDGYQYLPYGTYSVYHGVETVTSKSRLAESGDKCVDCAEVDKAEPAPVIALAPLEPIPPPEDLTVIKTAKRTKAVGDTIWVDASNVSGMEDGSAAHPYNTINEGILAAASGEIVRVLPGVYPENVVMADGVNVIGSGADDTAIDPGGTGWGVRCIGIGSSTVFSGFTIRNAVLGVYCHTSDLKLRENTIANIAPGSLSGDGIRLDDSAPLIQNNLIYDVGGMGIRAQGNSEPDIINNTIYNYRYYAAISFAALNIGAVSPLIENNIIMRGNTSPVGGVLSGSPSSPIVAYNDVFDPKNVTGGGSYYAHHDGFTWNEVSGGPGAIVADPMFIDAASGYFYLDPSSPCVDAGDPAAIYNDSDGSRNDMGAFGGQRLDLGPSGHSGSGFIFTGIGKVPITELVKDPGNPSHGLLTVSATTAADLHIHQFTDAPLGGYLWFDGLFGATDEVDYYQILAAPYGTSATTTLNDPLAKTLFTINPDGSVTGTRIQMGPHTIGGVPDVYLLNKEGYWSFTALRYIWNTTGLNEKYTVSYKAYREVSPGNLVEVLLPRNELDVFTARLNNRPVQMQIEDIAYSDHTSIAECDKIGFPHLGDSSLIFTITAFHPDGFLRYYDLVCYYGNNRYGGRFTYDQYVGSHDIMPPTWEGVLHHEFPPLLPKDSNGVPMDWHTCAYHFHLGGSARTTDGIQYLKWGEDNVYQSVVTGVGTVTPTATPPGPTPTPGGASTPTPSPTATPAPAQLVLKSLMEGYYDSGTHQTVPHTIDVELRSNTDPTILLRTISGLVSDVSGQIATNGVPPFGSYYVVVKQFNHLAIMSALPKGFSGGLTTTVDFSLEDAFKPAEFLPSAQTVAADGRMMLRAGDINQDGFIFLADFAMMVAQWGTAGPESDLNGDGVVSMPDNDLLSGEWGESSYVPAAVALKKSLPGFLSMDLASSLGNANMVEPGDSFMVDLRLRGSFPGDESLLLYGLGGRLQYNPQVLEIVTAQDLLDTGVLMDDRSDTSVPGSAQYSRLRDFLGGGDPGYPLSASEEATLWRIEFHVLPGAPGGFSGIQLGQAQALGESYELILASGDVIPLMVVGGTPVPTSTPTQIPDYDVVHDQKINAKDLLQIFGEIRAGSREEKVLFDFARFWMD